MDENEISIQSLDKNGDGVHKKGTRILVVENTLPGDVVNASIPKRLRSKKTKIFVKSFITQKIPRIKSKCYYASACGGCKFQEITYQDQLQLKYNKVLDSFLILKDLPLPVIQPIIPAPEEFYYRNKMEFTFSNKRWLTNEEMLKDEVYNKTFALGMHTPNNFDRIIDIKECYLQSPYTSKMINWFRDFSLNNQLTAYDSNQGEGYMRFLVIKESSYHPQKMINLITRTQEDTIILKMAEEFKKQFPEVTSFYNTIHSGLAQTTTGEKSNLIYGEPFLLDSILGNQFEITPFSFFQPNTKAAEKVYAKLIELAQFKGHENVLDLYSGVGSISLAVAPKVNAVIGFEMIEEAVQSAIKNQIRNNIPNCKFFAGDLKDLVKTHPAFSNKNIDIIIVDPPRSGLHPHVIDKIIELQIPTILYVSCNPYSQAENLLPLCSKGNYRITDIQPIDMLPQTFHIENIVKLQKNEVQ